MKKTNILIVLGLFVLLVGVAQPAYAGIDVVQTFGSVISPREGQKQAAHLNAAINKFGGTLQAYSVGRNQNVEEQIFRASADLSSSLEQFNTALMEAYPTLSEKEQLAVREAYTSLGLYLEDLAARTNLVFGIEVFRVIKQSLANANYEVEVWVGSRG